MPDGMVKYRRKSDGKTGSMPQAKWDSLRDHPAAGDYEIVNEAHATPEGDKALLDMPVDSTTRKMRVSWDGGSAEMTEEQAKQFASEYGPDAVTVEPILADQQEKYTPGESAKLGAVSAASFGLDPLMAGVDVSPIGDAILGGNVGGREYTRVKSRGVDATDVMTEDERAKDAGRAYLAMQEHAFSQNPGSYMGGALAGGAVTAAPAVMAGPGAAMTRGVASRLAGESGGILASQAARAPLAQRMMALGAGGAVTGALEGGLGAAAESQVRDPSMAGLGADVALGAGTGALIGGAAGAGLEGLGDLARGVMQLSRRGNYYGENLRLAEEGGAHTTMLSPTALTDVPMEQAATRAAAKRHVMDAPLPGGVPTASTSVSDLTEGRLGYLAAEKMRVDTAAMKQRQAETINRPFYASPAGQRRESTQPVADAIEQLVKSKAFADGAPLPGVNTAEIQKALADLYEVPPGTVVNKRGETYWDVAARVEAYKEEADALEATRADLLAASGGKTTAQSKRLAERIRNFRSIAKAGQKELDAAPKSIRTMNAEELDTTIRAVDESAGFMKASGRMDDEFKRLSAVLRQYRESVWGKDWANQKAMMADEIGALDVKRHAIGAPQESTGTDAATASAVGKTIRSNPTNQHVFEYVKSLDNLDPSEQPLWYRELQDMQAETRKRKPLETEEEYASRNKPGVAEKAFLEMRGHDAWKKIARSRGEGGAVVRGVELTGRFIDPMFRLVSRLAQPAPGAAITGVAARSAPDLETLGSAAERAQAAASELPSKAIETVRAWKRSLKEQER